MQAIEVRTEITKDFIKICWSLDTTFTIIIKKYTNNSLRYYHLAHVTTSRNKSNHIEKGVFSIQGVAFACPHIHKAISLDRITLARWTPN